MKTALLSLATLLLLPLSACQNNHPATAGDALKGQLTITGSSTIAPLAADMAQQFEQLHPGVRIDVQTGGSSRGINDARNGIADLGMVSRALKNNEHDLQSYLLARDGIGIIVHTGNPLKKISREQVLAIYRGELQNWQTLTGNDAPITVVHKAAGRSTQELFLDHFKLRASEVRAHAIIGDNEQAVKLVAGNPNAIAYVSIGTAEYDIQQSIAIKLLQLDGKTASSEAIAAGAYPLMRELNLVGTQHSALIDAFVNFSRSPSMADTVRRYSFVPL